MSQEQSCSEKCFASGHGQSRENHPISNWRYVTRILVFSAQLALPWCHLQGGFLFTTVVSCLQWPGTQNGHWSAAASFYSCQLLAFVAIVTGSQQMLVLPGERPHDSDEEFDTSTGLDSKDRHEREKKESDKQYLQAVVRRLRDTRHEDRPNPLLVFALQAPIMLLTLSFMAYLAGLCSVIFAPLARQPVWGDNAKVQLIASPSSIVSQLVGTDCSLFWRNWFAVYRCFRHCLLLGAQTLQLAARARVQDTLFCCTPMSRSQIRLRVGRIRRGGNLVVFSV